MSSGDGFVDRDVPQPESSIKSFVLLSKQDNRCFCARLHWFTSCPGGLTERRRKFSRHIAFYSLDSDSFNLLVPVRDRNDHRRTSLLTASFHSFLSEKNKKLVALAFTRHGCGDMISVECLSRIPSDSEFH